MKTYITDKTEKRNTGRQVLVCLFWLALWQIAALMVDNVLLLPSPVQTASALAGLATEKSFYLNVAWTLFRCLTAMFFSFVLGAATAWLAYRREFIRSLLTLPVGFFKAVPVMAIIIYVILLANADWVAVIVCFVMCFPIVYTNILAGLDSMPTELLELAKVYWLTDFQTMKHIYIPGIRFHIRSAIRLIAGLSWKAVVAAEVMSVPKFSLGYEMLSAKYYLETPQLFAYIFTIVILSLVLEKIINMCMRRADDVGYEGSKLFHLSGAENKLPLSDLKAHMQECKNDMGPEVTLCNISKAYGEKLVLSDLNIVFEAGKITVIMGPSGQGKTTLARIIASLESGYSGHIRYDKGHRLSYLFQEDRLIPWLNVYDNLAVGMLRDKKSPNNDVIMDMAIKLEIEEALWKLPEELSGGMKHRVALGRTFLANSNLMILDEPFKGLDDELKKRIILKLWASETRGKTVIVITHSQEDANLLRGKVTHI